MNTIYLWHIQSFITSFILALALVPVIRKLCIKKNLVDIPNERKVHKTPIPRLGGVAIWASVIITFLILVFINHSYPYGNCISGILIGGSLMFILGAVDDIHNLNPKFKLFIQINAALIAFLLGVRIDVLFNPFGAPIELGIFNFPITLLWIVGISNAMNFIDGVDGLAGGVGVISSFTLCIVALYTNQPISALVAAILAGSMLGFLSYNFHPAKIFMGDSGALFSGFVLACLSVTGVLKTVTVTILLPVIILAVPILDISYSVFRRILKRENPFIADSEHLHHKLLKAGFSHNKTSLTFYIICISLGALATSTIGALRLYSVFVFVLICLMVIIANFSKLKRG